MNSAKHANGYQTNRLSRGNEKPTWILEHGRSTKRSLEYPDRGQDESRANLHQRRLGRTGRLQWVLFHDLEVSEPDLVVEQGKGEDVVDEWFQFSGCFRHGKGLQIAIRQHETTEGDAGYPHA